MEADSRKSFVGRKLKTLKLVMSRADLSPAEKIVFWRLSESLNPTHLRAWLAQATIADFLKLDIKTVKRAIARLHLLGLIQILKIKQRNEYVLAQMGDDGDLTLLKQENEPRRVARVGPGRGQKGAPATPSEGGMDGLRFPYSRIPISNSLDAAAIGSRALGNEQGHSGRSRDNYRLREQRGDEAAERQLIKIFDELGVDGMETVSRLHQIDGGQPRLRLLQLLRANTLSSVDLHSAILAAESRK